MQTVANPSVGQSDQAWLTKILPIIRVRRRPRLLPLTPHSDVVALYPQALVVGRSRTDPPVPESCATPDGPLLVMLVYQVLEHVPRKAPWEATAETRSRPGKDRSGRQPFRSDALGLALKMIGGIILIPALIGQCIIGWMAYPLALVGVLL